MDIRYAGKHFSITDGIREHLQERLGKLEKYSPKIVESHVVLAKEKYLYDAQITLLAKNFQAFGEGRRKDNIYAAIDLACERVEKQLKKFREKMKDHHKEHGEKALSPKVKTAQSILKETPLGDRKPRIMKVRGFSAKPMSVEEASLQLEISDQRFLFFRNAVTKSINVLVKQSDGNHGLIEPEF